MGYHRAGFDVVGVDIESQPHYPFEFHQADALAFLEDHADEFDVIHASPPCQGYSLLAFAPNRDMSKYPMVIPKLRQRLIASGLPYVIENVTNAPLENPLVLCGTMFGLLTHKHRAFECKPAIWFAPSMCNRAPVKPAGTGKRLGQYYSDPEKMATVAGHLFSIKTGSKAMGIDWMTKGELAEAIPPAYTEFIGKQMLSLIPV